MTVIKKGFEKEFVADVITDRNKEGVLTSRVSGKVTDDETKSTLSGNSLLASREQQVLTMREVLLQRLQN